MRNRRAFACGIALACLAVLCLGAYLRQREREILQLGRPVAVWCSTEDIKSFQSLMKKVDLRDVPMTYVRAGALVSLEHMGPLPPGALRWSPEEIERRVAVRTIPTGDQITLADLVPEESTPLRERIDQGRAMTLSVDEITGIAGYLSPGDRVDVLGLFDVKGPAGSDKVARVLALDRQVLACGPWHPPAETSGAGLEEWSEKLIPLPRAGRDSQVTSVTLLLSCQEAQCLSLAQEAGLLSLLLRGSADRDPEGVSDVRLSELGLDVAPPERPRYREIRGQEVFGHQPLPSIKVLSSDGQAGAAK